MFWHVFSPRFLPLLPEPIVIISLLLIFSSSPTCFVEVTWVQCPWKWIKQMGKQCGEFKDTSILWEAGRRAEDRYIRYPPQHNKLYQHLAAKNSSHLTHSPWESGIEKAVAERFCLRVPDGVAVKAVSWGHHHLKLGLTPPFWNGLLIQQLTGGLRSSPLKLSSNHETGFSQCDSWERGEDRSCRVLLWPSLGSEAVSPPLEVTRKSLRPSHTQSKGN